jgi:predicted enzyme related to lactoylglutathione lyase
VVFPPLSAARDQLGVSQKQPVGYRPQLPKLRVPPTTHIFCRESFVMAVTRIVANLTAPDPMALAKFYKKAFELDLPFDMGWIAFLSKDSTQKIELHTASDGGSGTELPVISIGVEDLDATEMAVRAAGGEMVYGPITEDWGLRRFFFRDPAGNLVNVVNG